MTITMRESLLSPLIALCLLLLVSALSGQERPTALKVIAELANIREKPDIGSAILHQFPNGTPLEATEKTGDWYRIAFADENGRERTGYVHESLVQLMSDPFQVKPEPVPPAVRHEVPPPPPLQISEPAPRNRPAAPRKDGHQALAVAVSGGGLYLAGGDLNSGIQGLADYYRISLGASSDLSPDPLHLGAVFGAEATLDVTPSFSIGLGADYFLGKEKSQIAFLEDPETWTLTTRPEMTALPVRLAFIFHPQPFISLKVGAEYIFARCRYAYRMESGETWEEWTGNAASGGFGIMAGIGTEQRITSFASLFCELSARYARISSFEGTSEYRASSGLESTEDGFLYSYQGEVSQGVTFPLLFIREKKPTEAGVSEAEKATLDLSGFGLRLGLRLRF